MARASAAAAFGLYRFFGILIRPIAPLLLAYRVSRGKEDRERIGERYGRPGAPRPEGRLVWVHAASVGETNAILPLVKRITAGGQPVLLTTVTLTAARIASERLPAGAVHQFSPIDSKPWTEAFLSHWQPDLAIFVESEIWPQAIMSLARRKIPLVIANARLSERSFAGWRRYRSVARALFSQVSLCLAQSARDGERYRSLGAPSVVVTGNLKFDLPPPTGEPDELALLEAAIGARPVWVAASTHPGEEEAVAHAHRLIAAEHPGLLTIVVPRHPERGPEVAAALAARGHRVARRRAGEPLSPAVDIYVADTLGELGLFYRVAPVAFIGGSLVEHGGQNPIEPISLGAAVLHGPHVHNFADIYEALDKAGASRPVADAAALAAAAGALLGDPAAREKCVAGGRAALKPFSGALTATWRALRSYLADSAGDEEDRTDSPEPSRP